MSAGVLVVLRGNSGSGKTSVAREVQRRLPRGTCAVVSQDVVRRLVLREPDTAGQFNVELIGTMAGACLARGLSVLVEGILSADRYQRMLEDLASQAAAARFFAWDLPFEETVRRHGTRPQREEFTADDMRRWFHGWQPLDFVEEVRFDAATGLEDAVAAVLDAAVPGDGAAPSVAASTGAHRPGADGAARGPARA
jgi:predicted kinase